MIKEVIMENWKKKAFPTVDYIHNEDSGMSKRFYAACKAMQAMFIDKLHPNDQMVKEIVKDAYRIADEMLKQEEQK